jgi:hypothetical protein
MWYNFKTHDKMTDEVFTGLLEAEIKEGKDPLTLLAIARSTGWQYHHAKRPNMMKKTKNRFSSHVRL